MRSPKLCKCGARGACVETKHRNNYVKRRYHCVCGKRWTTYETRAEDIGFAKEE